MKKLALVVISCLMTITVCSQSKVVLKTEGDNKLSPSNINIEFDIEGESQFSYLRVADDAKFVAIKLGYDENAVFSETLDLNEGKYQFLEIVLKDLGSSIDWNKLKLNLNETYPNTSIILGNYLDTKEEMGDGWFKLKIPVEDLNPQDILSHITFPHTFNVDLGVKRVEFTGGSESFVWFGEEKYDNAIKENQTGQANIVFSADGIVPDDITLYTLSSDSEFHLTSMPFHIFNIGTTVGVNKFVGKVVDTNGNIYLSDTLSIDVAVGLKYVVRNVSCYGNNDGSIDIEIEGGTPPYTYLWSNGQNTADISGLKSGAYSVTVWDAQGQSLTKKMVVEEPNVLRAEVVSQNCNYGNSFLEVTGGKAPYQYTTDGETFHYLGDEQKDTVWHLASNISTSSDRPLKTFVEIDNDQLDNIYVAGKYVGVTELGGAFIGYPEKSGSYLAKFNPEGTLLWNEYGINIEINQAVTNPDGLTCISMVVNEDQYFANEYFTSGTYLLQFNKDGAIVWVKPVTDQINKMDVDGFGNLYCIYQDEQTGRHFLSKYDNTGNLLLNKNILSSTASVEDLDVSKSGDIYIIGSFTNELILSGVKIESKGGLDAYVVKFNSTGETLWTQTGSNPDNNVWGRGIAVDEKNNVYVTLHYFKVNGQFADVTFDQAVEPLIKLDAQTGDLIWARPFSNTLFSHYIDTYDIQIDDNGDVFVACQIYNLIVKDGEDFAIEDRAYHDYIIRFDDLGTIKSFTPIGLIQYGGVEFPMTITNDNHLVHTSHSDYMNIIKSGAPMKVSLELNDSISSITIKDRNECSYEINQFDSANLELNTPDICYISTESTGNKIILSNASEGKLIKVYRENYAVNDFTLVGSGYDNKFLDSTVNVSERSYRYVATVVNDCGIESTPSEAHKTIHLTVSQGNQGQVNLIWDGYEGFEYNSYNIYKGSSPSDMQLLTSVPSYLFTYTDLDPSIYTQHYQIRIENNEGCVNQTSTTGRKSEQVAARVITSNVAANFGEVGNLTFFPNPAYDRVHVKFSPDGDEYQLRVVDTGGRTLIQMDGIFDQAVIERGNLPAGIYNVILNKKSGKPLHGRVVFN